MSNKNNLAEKYKIDDYWCEKCCWYPKRTQRLIDESHINSEGEIVAPCEKCGHLNEVVLSRIENLAEDRPFHLLMEAMDEAMNLIVQEIWSREFEEKMKNMPIYRPPLELICNTCGGKYLGSCPNCITRGPQIDSFGRFYYE